MWDFQNAVLISGLSHAQPLVGEATNDTKAATLKTLIHQMELGDGGER